MLKNIELGSDIFHFARVIKKPFQYLYSELVLSDNFCSELPFSLQLEPNMGSLGIETVQQWLDILPEKNIEEFLLSS